MLMLLACVGKRVLGELEVPAVSADTAAPGGEALVTAGEMFWFEVRDG